MPKTFTDVVSAKPKVVEMQIAVDDSLNLTTLSAVVQYNLVDGSGNGLATNRVKVDILSKLGAATRTSLATTLKTQLTAAVNEYV